VEFELIVPKGLTNGASHLSGRTNVKNLKVHLNYKDDLLFATTGSGQKRTFERSGYLEDGWVYFLEKSLEKSNGSIYNYYHKENSLLKISCKNKKTNAPYSHVNFLMEGPKDYPTLKVTTSDKREFRYQLSERKYHVRHKEAHSTTSVEGSRYYLKTPINMPANG